MNQVMTKVGPADHGRSMTLAEFAHADGESGYLYELAQGVIEVVNVPGLPHGRITGRIRHQLETYWGTHPSVIEYIAGGGEAAMQLEALQSERHPDVSVYLSSPPSDKDPWGQWIPDIVVEVVSAGSRKRDYDEKPEEYLAVGVRECWIVDPVEPALVVLRRKDDDWCEDRWPPDGVYETPLLPGFSLSLEKVFAHAT